MSTEPPQTFAGEESAEVACSARFPDGPGMWLWSEHDEPVEVWVLGWYDDTPEEDEEWNLDDLRFEIEGRRYVPVELSGTWTKAGALNATSAAAAAKNSPDTTDEQS